MELTYSVDSRVERVLQDTANVRSVNNTDLNITIYTPVRAPRVLDEEVFLTVLRTVTNGKNSMAELVTAARGNHTTGVGLEDGITSINSHSGWLLSDSSLELVSITVGDEVLLVSIGNTR